MEAMDVAGTIVAILLVEGIEADIEVEEGGGDMLRTDELSA